MQSVSNGTLSAVGVSSIGCVWACTSSFPLNRNFPDKPPEIALTQLACIIDVQVLTIY